LQQTVRIALKAQAVLQPLYFLDFCYVVMLLSPAFPSWVPPKCPWLRNEIRNKLDGAARVQAKQ